MELHKCLLILGQLLSIAGTVGLAIRGFPQKAYDTTGHQILITEQINEESKRAGIEGLARHTRLSRVFLWTLAAGMVIQLGATLVGN